MAFPDSRERFLSGLERRQIIKRRAKTDLQPLPPEILSVIVQMAFGDCEDGFERQQLRLFTLGLASKTLRSLAEECDGSTLAIDGIHRCETLLRLVKRDRLLGDRVECLWIRSFARCRSDTFAQHCSAFRTLMLSLRNVAELHYRLDCDRLPTRELQMDRKTASESRAPDVLESDFISLFSLEGLSIWTPFFDNLRTLDIRYASTPSIDSLQQVGLPEYCAILAACPNLEDLTILCVPVWSLHAGGTFERTQGYETLRTVRFCRDSLPLDFDEPGGRLLDPDFPPARLLRLTLEGHDYEACLPWDQAYFLSFCESLSIEYLAFPATANPMVLSNLKVLSAISTKIADIDRAAELFTYLPNLRVWRAGSLLPASQGQLITLCNRLPCVKLIVRFDRRWSKKRRDDLEAVCEQSCIALEWE